MFSLCIQLKTKGEKTHDSWIDWNLIYVNCVARMRASWGLRPRHWKHEMLTIGTLSNHSLQPTDDKIYKLCDTLTISQWINEDASRSTLWKCQNMRARLSKKSILTLFFWKCSIIRVWKEEHCLLKADLDSTPPN